MVTLLLRDVWQCMYFLVTQLEGVMLIVPSRWRSKVLLNIIQYTKKQTNKKSYYYWSKMSGMPGLGMPVSFQEGKKMFIINILQ